MYIYFDVNGNLKEIVQVPVREGSIAHNKIYIYVEGTDYHLPVAYTNAKINFKLLDTDENLNPNGGNSVAMTKVSNIQIPYDNKRDLYFFKYGIKYEMWMVNLPETVTSVNGVVTTTAYLYNITEQFPLNTFNFNVESSVGVTLDSTMTQAQYSYLYNHIVMQSVPYTGATNNVDLGEYGLKADKLAMIDSQNNGVMIEMYDNKVSFTVYEEGIAHHNFYLPTNPPEQTTTFATQEWVTPQLPAKQVAGQFNTNDFEDDIDHNTQVIDVNVNLVSGSDLLVITWGGCFAICPLPASGPGRVAAALWNANGESQIVRIRYQIFTMGSQKILQITLPGNFQLPDNFTGYVISYKIA